MEAVHKPAHADDPQAHARGRGVVAVEDRPEVLDAGALVADPNIEGGGRPLVGLKFDPACPRVLKDVAGEFGDGRGHSSLVLRLEPQQAGHLPGALAGQYDVLLQANLHVQDRSDHPFAPHSRAANTVTSSRPRLKSR
jgi:hypothetical protein